MCEKYVKVRQIKLPVECDNLTEKLKNKAALSLRIKPGDILNLEITRKSLDARDKEDVFFSYEVLLKLDFNTKIKLNPKDKNVCLFDNKKYEIPKCGDEELKKRPVICGFGPAGIFCALNLAKAGFKPIVLERGKDVDERSRDMELLFKEGILNTESNAQFGEGGAGTFSDGKLNTTVKDSFGRNKYVLDTFADFGANDEIRYVNKPHIGTDVLKNVIKNIRMEIEHLGGEIRFNSKLTGVKILDNKIKAVVINNKETLETDVLVLAIGHSARDTFEMLYNNDFPMTAKPFAVGVRVQTPQELIDINQYGEKYAKLLPAADYKLTHTCKNGHGVYSFCMCPGGYVINASSENNRTCVNGMSYSKRDSNYANSAIIVSVSPSDYSSDKENIHPLSGVRFQRMLEEKAYNLGDGKIPAQNYSDFEKNLETAEFNDKVMLKGLYKGCNIREIFPDFINESIIEAMPYFNNKINGFVSDKTIIMGPESRTSSPLRISRDEDLVTKYKGVYPCGEGCGYAGGITSAAIDGIKVSEKIIMKYKKYGA